MDFLNKLVLPQSAHHMELLRYLLGLTFLIFLPYLSLLIGTTLFSVMYNSKGRKYNNNLYIKFSKDLIDIITFNKSVSFGLGIVPIFSATFCYAQLLHSSGVSVTENLIFAAALFFIAIVAIYTYKYSFHLKDILKFAALQQEDNQNINSSDMDEFKTYQTKANKILLKSGPYGLIFLFAASYIFIGAVEFAADTARWAEGKSIVNILLSGSTLISYLSYLAASLALTSVGVLYLILKPDNEKSLDSNYAEFVKKFSLRTGLIFTAILPLLLTLELFTFPKTSLSGGIFGVTVIILFLLLVLCIQFYFMLKESHIRYRSSALFVFLVVFAFLIIRDEYAFQTSTQLQVRKLAGDYEEYVVKLKEEMGIAAPAVSGEDIFKGRCIACHNFDKKIVGPPYNRVLPKYEGKFDDLVEFILNPVKVNPEYPSMPNQGLKPNEAKAIAEYLMNTYKK